MGSLPQPFNNANPYESQGNYRHTSRRGIDSAMDGEPSSAHPTSINDANFDILEWFPAYQSCQRYFIDHAQYEPATQAVCALINIRLPFQWLVNPVTSSTSSSQQGLGSNSTNFNFTANAHNRGYASPQSRAQNGDRAPVFISALPYIRRLVVTGFDKPAILHGFFGDSYTLGIMPHVECERRNYLFAAKHGGWRTCKKQYDSGSGGGAGQDETLPFMKPLDGVEGGELAAAEKAWSKWLAMEDWMVGPHAPRDEEGEGARMRSGRASVSGNARYHEGGRDGGLVDGDFQADGGARHGGLRDGGLPDGI